MTIENESGDTQGAGETAAASADAASTATDSQASTDSAKVEGQGDAGKTGAEAGAADDQAKAGGEADKGEAGTEEGKGEGGDAAAVPEKYEVPEGYTIEPDDMEFISGVAKERGFTQEQFNASVEKWQEMRNAEANRTTERWGNESKSLLGDKYDATVDLAKRGLVPLQAENPELYEKVMQAYGAPSEGGLGWGNHPAMLQLMAFYGSKLKEDGMHGLGGQTAESKPMSAGERAYQYADKPVKRTP